MNERLVDIYAAPNNLKLTTKENQDEIYLVAITDYVSGRWTTGSLCWSPHGLRKGLGERQPSGRHLVLRNPESAH